MDAAWTRLVFDDSGVGRVRTADAARPMRYTVDSAAHRVVVTLDGAAAPGGGTRGEARYELSAAPERLVLVTADSVGVDSARAVLRPRFRGLPVDRGVIVRR